MRIYSIAFVATLICLSVFATGDPPTAEALEKLAKDRLLRADSIYECIYYQLRSDWTILDQHKQDLLMITEVQLGQKDMTIREGDLVDIMLDLVNQTTYVMDGLSFMMDFFNIITGVSSLSDRAWVAQIMNERKNSVVYNAEITIEYINKVSKHQDNDFVLQKANELKLKITQIKHKLSDFRFHSNPDSIFIK